MGVEAGLCYNMGSVTAKPEWDIRLLSNCGCNHKCFHTRESHPPVRDHMSYIPTH